MNATVYKWTNMYGEGVITLDPRSDAWQVGTCELPDGFTLGQSAYGETFAYRDRDGMAFALRHLDGNRYQLVAQGGGTYDENDHYTIFVRVRISD